MSSHLPDTNHSLVGRGRERALLRQHLDAALEVRGSLVLVSGEAGIGKTALAEALCKEAAERGVLVLVGHCYDLAETPPYGPWVEVFARDPSGEGMPPLPDAFAERGTVGAVDSQDALQRRVLDFFAALCERQPVLLLLDDLHWADPASLDLLRSLTRSLATMPLLAIATYRSDELTRHQPLYPLVPLLVREAQAERLPLDALDESVVRALVTARYAMPEPETDRLAAYLHVRAEGNALFVGEVLRSLEEGGVLARDGDGWRLGDLTGTTVPALLRQVVDMRVARLDADAQRLLAVAAVIGQEVPLGVWASVADMDEEALLAAIEQAVQAALLAETPDGEAVRFTHALVREAIYQGEMAARRRRLHRAVAETLAAQPRPDPDAVAYHFQQAGDDRAVAWLMRAGERAQAAYALLTAAQRYEAALALMTRRGDPADERGWLLFAVSRLRRYSEPAAALRGMEEALALAREAGDEALLASAGYSRGVALLFAGRRREAVRELAAGADVFERLPPDAIARVTARAGVTEAWLRALRGGWMLHAATTGYIMAVLAHAERWETMQEPSRTVSYQGSGYADGWAGLGIAHAMAGDTARAQKGFRRALEAYRAIGHHMTSGATAFFALHYLALPYRADRPGESERWAEIAGEELRYAAGATLGLLDTAVVVGALLDLLRGRWDAPSFEGLRTLEGRRHETRRLALLARLACGRGERERAWEGVRASLPDGAATEPGDCDLRDGLELQRVATTLSLDAGDMAGAKEWLEAHDRWLEWSGAVLGHSEAEMLRAQYYRQAGEPVKAYDHAERALIHATEPRQPLALIAAHRLLGELDTEMGKYEDAVRYLEASLALADACHAPYERALTLRALAELRAATGERDDAMRLLDEVHAICEPLGARPALDRADALATRIATTQPAAPAYPAGLSAREVEVLGLVAQGLTNAQVAEQLFLGARTVETHLRSIYNKLGVSTRTAAAAFAVSHGLA